VSQPGGFSPGVAARLTTAHGRHVFVKAAGPEQNPLTPTMHRREAAIAAALPADAPVPRLLWTYDEGAGGWIALAFEDIDGRQPELPWRADELDRTLAAVAELAETLTPSPLPIELTGDTATWDAIAGSWWRRLLEAPTDRLDRWAVRNLDRLDELERHAPAASAGETLLHLDLRADNLLLTAERVLVVDWPHARAGAAWLDLAFLAPSVAMQGGPPPDELFHRLPLGRAADPDAVTAVVADIAGYFVWHARQPPPPGLPTVRAFQAAQGVVALEWLAQRTGWD
jgi:aminoglycoside phosphotransferase (APT) family kinase protein